MTPILYIVIPCYNEEAVLAETIGRLSNLMDQMIHEQEIISPDSYLLFVNDGSSDKMEYHSRRPSNEPLCMRS